MSKRVFNLAGCGAMLLGLAAGSFAQTQTPTSQQPTQQTTVTTQTTQTVQNADGTWSVIEYPAQKEVIVDFTPGANYNTAKGRARVMRMADRTMINLDLSGLPADVTGVNLYAVDPMGKVTLLGPVNVSNGVATQSFDTPLNRFMLMLSPEANLSTYRPDTAYVFRSSVPQGFAVVPLSSTDRENGAAVGEKVSATTTAGATSAYTAPMLNVMGMKRGDDTQLKVNLTGELTGSRVNFNIEPRNDGPTTVTARFHELKESPGGKVYVLWAVSPDNRYVKLGQVVNTGRRNEAEIKSETTLKDFGLLITLEEESSAPRGTILGTVTR
ncbi:MAG TPA: anti-sigma factor [Pyrinomonadaceae bacterium]